MKTKTCACLLTLLVLPQLGSCEQKHSMKYTIEVVDEDGDPVPSCKVGSSVFEKWESGEGFGRDIYDSQKVFTDKNGVAKFSRKSKRQDVKFMVYPSEEFYSDSGHEYDFKPAKNGVWQPENKEFKIVIKKIKDPIAMYARFVGMSENAKIPAIGKEVGFDLVKSDWVAPYGIGERLDLVFLLEIAELGEIDYDANLTISFSNNGDGLVSYEADPQNGSALVMPYAAPGEGYMASVTKETRKRKGKQLVVGYSEDQHYFLRVRTKLDEDGNVVSAHYGKIQGDIKYWKNGSVRFTYYLNPTPNDKNVEFDTKKNLFDIGRRGFKVQNP